MKCANCRWFEESPSSTSPEGKEVIFYRTTNSNNLSCPLFGFDGISDVPIVSE